MNKIYRRDTRHVTVEEAKRLIREARQWGDPEDIVHEVHVAEDGLLDVSPRPEDRHGLYVADDFRRDCQHLGIVPFDKYRPSLGATYPVGTEADSMYALRHTDFICLAELYGLQVVLGETPPETAALPGKPENPALDYSQFATRDQLISAFGRFTGMDLAWFDNLSDTPALMAARRVEGRGGRHSIEPMFCPFAVMLWLIDPKRRKGRRPMSPEVGWRLLQANFEKVYLSRSAADPRGD